MPYRTCILRGTLVNRTYGGNKNLYIYLFLPTIFGPIYYRPVRNSRRTNCFSLEVLLARRAPYLIRVKRFPLMSKLKGQTVQQTHGRGTTIGVCARGGAGTEQREEKGEEGGGAGGGAA